MERRLLLAVVLSSLVLMAYPAILSKFYPNQPTGKSVQTNAIDAINTEAFGDRPVEPEKKLLSARIEKPESQRRVENQYLSVVNSDRSGGVQVLVLPEYEDLETNQPVVVLHAEHPTEHLLSLISSDRDSTELVISGYDCSYQQYAATCRGVTASGFEITKHLVLDATKSVIRGSLSIKNTTSNTSKFAADIVLALTPTNGGQKTSYTHPPEVIVATRDHIHKASRDAFVKKPKQFNVQPSSIGLMDRHFCVVATLGDRIESVRASELSDGHGIQAAARLELSLNPSASAEIPVEIYAGPRDYHKLKAAGEQFTEVARPGFLGQVGLILLAVLNGINLLVKNYGISIILLTIIVSVMLVPFNLMSIKSMQRMKSIQPAVEKLRASCKDNKEKFNREYMELLKKHRVNPLAGCLVPLLIQMPIFFALLQVLSNSIELRGARFLWINDLSSPDRLAKLPFALPFLGNEFNLLPLLTVVAMYVQQKISQSAMPKTGSEEMPDFSVIMLAVFAVWMYHAPSGPVIYWLVNTTIMIVWFKIAMKPAPSVEVA